MAGTTIASLNDILTTRSKMTWARRINFDNISFNDIDEMQEWCKSHCTGLWRCEKYYALYFQFEVDQDAMMFMLKFGGRGAT